MIVFVCYNAKIQAHVCVCLCACVRACVRACVCACVRVYGRLTAKTNFSIYYVVAVGQNNCFRCLNSTDWNIRIDNVVMS